MRKSQLAEKVTRYNRTEMLTTMRSKGSKTRSLAPEAREPRVTLTFRPTTGDHERLRRLAFQLDCSMQDIMEEAIREKLAAVGG